jgi:hypothetical protein
MSAILRLSATLLASPSREAFGTMERSGSRIRPASLPPAGCRRCQAILAHLVPLVLLASLEPVAAFEFTDVSVVAGITEGYDQAPANFEGLDREYEIVTGGAVAEDFNADGWVDLFVVQGGLGPNLLYMNQQDGHFIEEAVARGVAQTGRYVGACGADYDSDGDVDLFVAGSEGGHILLTNDGTGTFSEGTAGISLPGARTTSPSWADVDGDGLLDLAMGAWFGEEPGFIHIYRNQGNGQFTSFEVIPVEHTFVPHFADLNGDGHVDLLAIADFGNTRFYFNNGRGVFIPAGTGDIENGMGVATGDPDNDGDLDVFMTAIRDPDLEDPVIGNSGNRLLVNDGHGEFTDVTTAAGVRTGYWAWGTVFADLENDGDEDLYLVNGWPSFSPRENPFEGTPAVAFENQGSMRFTDQTGSSGDAADTGQGRCAVTFDYDNDGDLDLFVVNNNTLHPGDGEGGGLGSSPGRLLLLRNDSASTGNWIKVRVSANAPHHAHGMGARVHVESALSTQMREINASSNFNGHGPYRITHFGLGKDTDLDAVRVGFPNGDRVWLEDVAVNQELTIQSPQASASRREVELGQSTTFQMPAESVPFESVVVWMHGGAEYSNPATLSFSTAGRHEVTVAVYADASRSELLRGESLRVKVTDPTIEPPTIARFWNETILDAIRMDFPDPTVHARNLFHLSVAMWDVWAAYDSSAVGYIHREFIDSADPAADRREAISYAAYRVLSSRYSRSISGSMTQTLLKLRMEDLGYPVSVTGTEGDSPAALGNRVAAAVIDWGLSDGSREQINYHDYEYAPVNPPLVLANSGTTLDDPNRWQPLQFEQAFTQNGLTGQTVQNFVGSHWREVRPFALQGEPATYLDPGQPPQLGGAGDADFKEGVVEVIRHSQWLDPDDGVILDISPRSMGSNSLGMNDGTGHGSEPNPATGELYEEHWVKRADYGRVVAEFWADGPESETPPGHWNSLANSVSDHTALERRYRGRGEVLDRLEWDVKLYLALNGALHDAAVAAWSCKRTYDYVRPISSIRYLSGIGELPEVPGLIEKITVESSAPGERHAELLAAGASVGDTAIHAWGGEPANPATEYTGSRWMLGEDWLPYQRDTFVTPAFAVYVSGHSAFSRAAAEVLTYFTGDPYFPDGLGTHHVPADGLEFEYGPSVDVTLQWATYADAADEAGISRIYGGIHVPADDGPGRVMGSAAGIQAMALTENYYDGSIVAEPAGATLVRGDQGHELRIRPVRGLFFKVESSIDLKGWQQEGEVRQALDSEVSFPVEASASARFFRVVQQENP